MQIEFDQARQKWAEMVGRFILAFGDIENITYICLSRLPKDSIYKSVSKLRFAQRVDLLLEILRGQDGLAQTLVEQFANQLEDAKTLAKVRNTVAHSPLMCVIYEHPTEEWRHIEYRVANSMNEDKYVTLESLADTTKQTEKLAAGLYVLVEKLLQQK